MEQAKAQNLIEHKTEILSRPAKKCPSHHFAADVAKGFSPRIKSKTCVIAQGPLTSSRWWSHSLLGSHTRSGKGVIKVTKGHLRGSRWRSAWR